MKIRTLLSVAFVSLLGFGFAASADTSLNREQFFTSYVDTVTKDVTVPETYKNMLLKYRGITKDTPIYQTMQKAVYYELFPNGRITLPLDKNVAEDQICIIIKRKFVIEASCEK